MALLNAEQLADLLANRFDLGFSQNQEDFDGEVFVIIRPDDLIRPNGFGVSIARTPRRVEASLKMDRFSRSLLRKMGESDEEARSHFAFLANIARNADVRITVSINGIPANNLDALSTDEWRMLELDCDTRLPTGSLSSAVLNEHAFKVLEACTGLVLSLLPVEEADDFEDDVSEGLPEGAKVMVEMNRYERNRVNRARCVSHHGAQCQACGFDFSVAYGSIGREVIEVHHKVPVSMMGGSYRINPIKDLVPVCANCHTMLHRREPPYSVEELREILSSQLLDEQDPQGSLSYIAD
jgi:5-methylcytosine-specific restriction protein A